MTKLKKKRQLEGLKNILLQLHAFFNHYNALSFEIRCTQTNRQTE